MNRYKTIVQKQSVTVASGTAPSNFSKDIQLNSEYDFCDGIYVVERSNGGITYDLGISDSREEYLEKTVLEAYQSSTAVPPNQRFLDVFIPLKDGIKTKADIATLVATTSELSFDVLYRLRKKLMDEETNKI